MHTGTGLTKTASKKEISRVKFISEKRTPVQLATINALSVCLLSYTEDFKSHSVVLGENRIQGTLKTEVSSADYLPVQLSTLQRTQGTKLYYSQWLLST